MSHTNKTVHYDLPQFIASDKGTWLGDLNTAFADIDAQMFQNEQATTQGNATASNAKAIAEAAHGEVEALSALVDRNTQKITTVKEVISSLQEDIGNADNLPEGTRDIVNAINTHENELQRLDGKIGTMESTLETVETTAENNTSSINTLSNTVHTIRSDIGNIGQLPQPTMSFAQNISNNNERLTSVEEQVELITNNTAVSFLLHSDPSVITKDAGSSSVEAYFTYKNNIGTFSGFWGYLKTQASSFTLTVDSNIPTFMQAKIPIIIFGTNSITHYHIATISLTGNIRVNLPGTFQAGSTLYVPPFSVIK